MFSILATVLLFAGLALADFDGQVTQVHTWIDMNISKLNVTLGGNFQIVTGNSTNITATGAIAGSNSLPIGISSTQTYLVPATGELHFQYALSFLATSVSSTPGPLGINNDPLYGCMIAGPTDLNDNAFFFILTNTKVYALVLQGDAGNISYWAIPIASRVAVTTDLYTVVVKGSEQRVLFRINNVDKVEIPGACGIDPKFRIYNGLGLPGCQPAYTPDFPFPQTFLNYIYVGPFNLNVTTPFCQGNNFDMCNENVSWAYQVNCQYAQPSTNFTINYAANIGSIEVFEIDRTNRCDGESSSSEYHNWWSRPCCNGDHCHVPTLGM